MIWFEWESGPIIYKKHSHISVLLVQIGEGSVKYQSYGPIIRPVPSVIKLQRGVMEHGADECLYQFLKAFALLSCSKQQTFEDGILCLRHRDNGGHFDVGRIIEQRDGMTEAICKHCGHLVLQMF